MASSDSSEEITEEITASSDSTKALRSSPSANHHRNAASSSATNNENDQHEEAPSPSFETIRNDLRDVNLAWKKYTAHMNAKIYVAGKEFKRLRNLGSIKQDFDKLQEAIANLELEVQKLQMIGSEPDLLDSAFAVVQKYFMKRTREKINQALAKSKDKSSKPSLAANFKAKYFSSKHKQPENNQQIAASSTGTTNKNDQHGEALFLRSKMIRNDLDLVNLAWNTYTNHMNAKISVASKEFKRLRRKYPDNINMASEEFKKDIKYLKSQVSEWQISSTSNEDDHYGGALYKMIGSELNLLVSAFDEAQKFKETDFDKFQKAIEKLKSQVKEMQIRLTSNEDDHDGRALSQMMRRELDLLASAFDEVRKFKETDFDKFQMAIENLKSQVKELQIPLTSKEVLSQTFGSDLDLLDSALEDFDKLQKAIKNLKSQVKDDHDGGTLSQTFDRNPDPLDSAFEEGQIFMESTGGETNQLARAKSNELQEANSEKQRKGKSSELRKDIGKLRALIRSYGEIRSTDFNQHPYYEWPNINGVEHGMMHFFFMEPPSQPNTEEVVDGMMMHFNKLPEPVRYCLLCFFKFPPEAFVGRTTMIYLWIGQGYIHQHLKKEYQSKEEEELLCLEEEAGKNIFDELITNGFIERYSLEPNRCRMSPSARSSLYEEAEAKGFTSNGTLDLGPESVRGKLCLINVGEAIINCKPEIFGNMEEHVRSLYFGRWQTSAMHHIELADSKIHHGMNKLADTKILHGINKLKSLSFLSLRGISMITELPKFISELNNLKILDLRACHNLEAMPIEIGSLQKLTHLDMSECYFLEHMPKSLSQLSKLEVLKGFFIGDSKNNNQSCTLSDLSKLSKLRKLNIYTSVEKFPATPDLNALRAFQGLLKLAISWGGFSSPVFTAASASQEEGSQEEGEETLHPKLQKLDLRGFPKKNLPCWLWPSDLKDLRKLYIRGGNLCDLGQLRESLGEHWTVEILRLKYLDALEIEWSKLMILFPKLIYLHEKKCSKINFQGDERSVWSEWKGKESSVWMHKKAIDTRLRLQQKFFRSDVNSINLSSLLGYNQ